MGETKESMTAKVNAKGDEIRKQKAAKAPKEVIMPLVAELCATPAPPLQAPRQPSG